MGDASRRGPPELRQAQGVARRLEREQLAREAAAAREAALTPEQRERRLGMQLLLAGVIAPSIHLRKGRW